MSNLATSPHNLADQSASLPDRTHSTQKLPINWFEVSTMLDTLTKEAAVTVSACAACLYIFDQQQAKLLPYFSCYIGSTSPGFTEQEVGQGIAGWAAKTKRSVLLDKLHSQNIPEPINLNFVYNSALALPLLDAGEPVGVLLVIDKNNGSAFAPADEQQLQVLLSHSGAAQAIRHAILSRQKPDWIESLNTLNQVSLILNTSLQAMDVDDVCRNILQMPGLKHIFQYDIAEICLWNSQARTLSTARRLPDDNIHVQRYNQNYHLNQGYTGWIAAHQKPLLIGDTHTYTEILPKIGIADFPFRSYVGAPLKIGAKLLGTIELAAAPIDLYDDTTVALLEVVANHAAVVIDHARLFQQTQRNLSKLSVLFDTSRELSANLSYEELLRDTSSRIAELFRADECTLYSFDETAGVLMLVEQSIKVASLQVEEPQRYSSRPLGQDSPWLTVAKFPALQEALKAQVPFIARIDDPHINEHELEWLTQKGYGIMVVIPIVSREKVMGLVQLFATNPNTFTEDDIWLAQSLINQVSIALENARLFSLTDQQLQKRVNELAGLQRVSSELNSTLDLNHILDLVLEEATRVTLADFGSVNLYDAKTNRLVAHKEQGKVSKTRTSTSKTTTRLQTISFSTTQDITKRALRTGTAILIADVSKERSNIGVGRNVRSKAAVPIFYRGEPVGVISLESRQPNFFTEDQLRYLEALANQAAVAIGNTQAYLEQKRERERANRRAEQLTRLSKISDAFLTNRPILQILEDIAFAIAESVGYQVVLISLIEGNPAVIQPKVGVGIPVAQLQALQNSVTPYPLTHLQVVMQAEFRLGNSYFVPVERAAVWRDKLNVPEIEQKRPATQPLTETERLAQGLFAEKGNAWQPGDMLFVPLTDTKNQIIGLLTVENPDTDERPDNLLIQTLEIFANHAAAAIENLRLFEQEKQRRRLTDTLRSVAEAISSQLNFDELLNTVFQRLAEVIEYDSANLQLLQDDKLVIIGGRGWPDSQQVMGLSFSMAGNNPGRRVVETQEPLIIGDVQLAYPESFDQPPHDWIRSWLGAPLTYGINVLGLVAVDSAQPDFFTPEDAEVLLAFANQVAVAWQNAHLFEQAKKQVRQLAALTEVAQSLNRALDLNEVLNLVMDAIFDLVGYSKGSIWLIDYSTNTVKIADTKNVPNFLVELFNESAISIDSEPFATVIKTGHELVIRGSATKDEIANYGLPIPDDVTYVPLKTEDGVIGILAIETDIRDRDMLKLVNTLADLAAVAIDSARMLEDTRQRANEMQHLYRLGVEVSGLLDVRQVMCSVVSNALTLTNTQIGTILFWDDENKGYIIDGALNTDNAIAQIILNEAKESLEIEASDEVVASLWSGLTRYIMDTGQPAMIMPQEQPALPRQEPADLIVLKRPLPLGVRAILGVPIQVQNQSSGAIFVCTLTWRNFDERDVQLLSFVANQAAVAVRNAQLVRRLNLFTEELERRVALRTEELGKTLEDLTEERDRVEALYQITRELSASLDLDRVLAEALSLINRAVGISHGSILLFDHETGALIYRAALGRDRALPRGGAKTPYRPGYGLAGKIIESRQARIVPELLADPDWIISNDNSERASALAVPLITGEDVLGVLMLFHPEIDYFTEDHLKLVTAAGAQIATAINNAELYRLITDQAQRLGTMLRTQAAETAKNQAILRGITDGVLVLDAYRITVLVNPKAAEILNLSIAELENRSVYQSLGQLDDSEERQLARLFYQSLLPALTAIEAGERSAEFRIEADKKVVTATLASITLAADEQPSVIAVLRDVSKEAEVERIKNEFISTVSHELRTPMTSIKGYADLLMSASTQVGELNPIQRRFIQIIQSNANRLTGLVNDILEISRIETGRVKLEVEGMEISQAVGEVAAYFEGLKVKKAMHLSVDLAEPLPKVYADKARVTQILVNLIGNAWQYTPENGHIVVRAKMLNEDFVQVDVEDNGIGIVEEDIPFIFDRFFRSERTEVQVVDGTGLGLSITKMFVEMLGGTIWLKSTLDIGTTFSFTLPIEPGAALGHLHQMIESPVESLQHSQVLLIDDNPAIVGWLQPRLKEAGYEVSVVTEPDQILNLAHQTGQALKLIFVSLTMENGAGFAILEQLKQDKVTTQIPIILSSLFVVHQSQEFSLELIDYISTAFTENEVLERVGQVLNGVGVGRILIVDDHQERVQWLKGILDGGGYKVQRAFNSQQALDVIAVNKPDLILVNVKMSDKAGETLMAHLHRLTESAYMPIIAITERQIPPPNDRHIQMLGSKSLIKQKRPLSSEALGIEIMQMCERSMAGARYE